MSSLHFYRVYNNNAQIIPSDLLKISFNNSSLFISQRTELTKHKATLEIPPLSISYSNFQTSLNIFTTLKTKEEENYFALIYIINMNYLDIYLIICK